jgi:plastocyanin
MASRSRTRILGAIALLSLVVVLGGCGSDDPSDSASDGDAKKPADTSEPTTDATEPAGGADAADITAQDFAFTPATIEVEAGTEVTITNDDGAPHTFTADDGSFDEALSAGSSATHTFEKPGSFTYHCEIHSSMKGTVEVS